MADNQEHSLHENHRARMYAPSRINLSEWHSVHEWL